MKRFLLPVSFVIFAACQQPAATATQEKQKDSIPPQAAANAVQTVLTELDTISIGGRLYNITEASQQEFDAVPGTQVDTSEVRALAKEQERVQRRGDSLIFQLDNGQQKVLVNNLADNDGYAEFHYQGYIPGLQHWVVYNSGYEWFSYDLVSKATGEVKSTIGLPQLSPDGKYFICSNSDLIAGFTDNGFELFEYKQGKIREVDGRLLEKWGPVEIKWKSADQLLAHMLIVNQDMEETSRYVRLTPR
jgi:hypothetical protein